MTIHESDLDQVEAAFGITLPGLCRQLLLSGSQPRAQIEWFDSAQSLIDINTLLLDDDEWDPAYFVIATNGAGDYYCIELETSDVAFYSHEERGFHEVGPFSEWVNDPVSSVPDPEAPSPIVGVLGCIALAVVLLLILALPTWLVLRAP